MQATLAAVLALCAGSVALEAQSPVPSPSPAPTPAAFTAQAHVNLTATTQTTFNASAQLAVAQLGPLTRVDVLSVQSDSLPIPPFTATALIDRRANTVTVWNDRSKSYYVQSFIPRPASPTPSAGASPRPSASPRRTVSPFGGTSPFAKLELLDITLHLTGHTTTAGLPTTGLAFELKVKKQGDAQTSHVSATTQLADEYAMFPVTIDLSLDPGTAPFSAKLAYAVDQFTRGVPAANQFQIPAGYTKAGSLFAVIFPPRRASPRRRPSP